MYCSKCNSSVKVNSSFCGMCGNSIAQASTNTVINPVNKLDTTGDYSAPVVQGTNSYSDADTKIILQGLASREAGIGTLYLIGGIVVTAVTYYNATPGGTYTVFYGAMLYGGYRFLAGLFYLANPKALIKKLNSVDE